MAFPESFIEELIDRNEISQVVSSYVQLSRKGLNLFGLCSFHSEKTPSFSVSSEKQIYHCFGCGKGGGVINFIMEIENLSYPDAVRFLASRAGIALPEDSADEAAKTRRRMLTLNREAARFYFSMLGEEQGAAARDYMRKRGITARTARVFGLGAAPDSWDALITAMAQKGYEKSELLSAGLAVRGTKGNIYDKFRNRLIFPVIDIRGEVLGFGGRSLDGGEPKYLNSPETPVFSKRRTLYAINLAKNTKRPNMILCEGNIDVITLHQAGFDNAVASMGTSLTSEQIRLMARYTQEVVVCYDNDEAGTKATARALEALGSSVLRARVLKLPNRIVDGKPVKQDADDFVRLQGAEAFEKLLTGSSESTEYGLEELKSRFDLTDTAQRVQFLKEAGARIAALHSPVEREVYCARVAELTGISFEAMSQEIARTRKRLLEKAKKDRERSETRPVQNAQPADRKLRYSNVRSAAAEEGLIRLLLLDPMLIPLAELREEEFSSPFLGKVYGLLKSRHKEKKDISLSLLAPLLEPEEISALTAIAQKPESAADPIRSMGDYITVIRTEKLKQEKDLMAIYETYKEKKGFGG